LRGAIPLGLSFGFTPPAVFAVSVIFNSLVFFPVYFGLEFFYEHLKKNNFIHRHIEKIRKKGHGAMRKYGIWGLIPFVAIPLPFTGAWTASIIAWLFDLEWWRAFAVIFISILIAGAIVTIGVMGAVRLIW